MKKQRFTGPMGPRMSQHLALRRSMGYIYKGSEYGLDAFDQFLAMHFPNMTVITRQMIIDYLDSIRELMPLTRSGRISILRQFCRFMFQYDHRTYIPEKGLIPAGSVQVKPHIFTPEEIQLLLLQASRLNVKSKLLSTTYATIIGLLWVTGMRVGEVVRLKVQDIDMSQQLLYIRQSKFYKSRAIPLLPSSTSQLLGYLKLRTSLGYPYRPEEPLFVNNRGKPCTISTTPKTITELIKRTGIKTQQNTTPRVHDIRHSFATRWLMEIYHSEKDPNSILPVLATYMGHANIANTQVYLHPDLELLDKAGDKLRVHIETIQGAGR